MPVALLHDLVLFGWLSPSFPPNVQIVFGIYKCFTAR